MSLRSFILSVVGLLTITCNLVQALYFRVTWAWMNSCTACGTVILWWIALRIEKARLARPDHPKIERRVRWWFALYYMLFPLSLATLMYDAIGLPDALMILVCAAIIVVTIVTVVLNLPEMRTRLRRLWHRLRW